MRQAGHVTSGAREAGHQSRADWITTRGHDDGNRAGRLLGREGRRSGGSHDEINLEAHEVGGKLGESVEFQFRKTMLDENVLALVVSELPEPLPQ